MCQDFEFSVLVVASYEDFDAYLLSNVPEAIEFSKNNRVSVCLLNDSQLLEIHRVIWRLI